MVLAFQAPVFEEEEDGGNEEDEGYDGVDGYACDGA